jgi:hypothetical protein
LRKFHGLSVRTGGFHSPEGGYCRSFISCRSRTATCGGPASTAGGEFAQRANSLSHCRNATMARLLCFKSGRSPSGNEYIQCGCTYILSGCTYIRGNGGVEIQGCASMSVGGRGFLFAGRDRADARMFGLRMRVTGTAKPFRPSSMRSALVKTSCIKPVRSTFRLHFRQVIPVLSQKIRAPS